MTPHEFFEAHGAPTDIEGRPRWTRAEWDEFMENNETSLADAGLTAPQPGATFELARSQDEILARYLAFGDDEADLLPKGVLFAHLDFDHARQLVPRLTEEVWNGFLGDEPSLEAASREYLALVISKVRSRRALAQWSVAKLREFAWLMGRDGVVTAMDGAAYEPYGEPKVRRFADGMGWPWMDSYELEAAQNRGGSSC